MPFEASETNPYGGHGATRLAVEALWGTSFLFFSFPPQGSPWRDFGGTSFLFFSFLSHHKARRGGTLGHVFSFLFFPTTRLAVEGLWGHVFSFLFFSFPPQGSPWRDFGGTSFLFLSFPLKGSPMRDFEGRYFLFLSFPLQGSTVREFGAGICVPFFPITRLISEGLWGSSFLAPSYPLQRSPGTLGARLVFPCLHTNTTGHVKPGLLVICAVA